MKSRILGALAASATAFIVAACGGGGGGIGGTGVSYGGITAFGSVWVNGVEFSSNGTTIKLDDRTVTQADLRVGMVVRVDGSIDDKTATTITVDDSIKGKVDSVIDANHILVMGQTVLIDDTTHFENGTPVKDDSVEVHGLVAGDGSVSAGFVRKLGAPPAAFEAKGLVKTHDPVGKTFTIGALGVNYANAAVSDLPATGSWVGLLVEAKGAACTGTPCSTLTASSVQASGLKQSSNIAQAEVEGFVTSGTAASFVLGTQAVATTASTVYEGGLSTDIATGVKLEVEGAISGGVLTAKKVSFRDNVRLEGNATVSGNALTITGLNGVSVSVNALTAYKGGIARLADLAQGDHVRIRGRASGSTGVVALEVEKRSADTRVILQAAVSTIGGTQTLTMLGILVDTSGVADTDFHDVSDASIGRTAFFSAVKVGTVVKARGKLNAASVTWDQMELEQ